MTAVARRRTRATAPPAAAIDAPVDTPRVQRYLVGFVVFQMVCQLALLSSAIGPFRVLVRSAVFASSVLLLFAIRGRALRHPAAPLATVSLAIVILSVLHPTTNNLISGVAHATLYVAVLAPLFWAARLAIDIATLKRLLLVIWMFHVLSAILGALQVYYPGDFQPNISMIYTDESLEGLRFTLANGEKILRPMGLTDTPGGAAIGGFYCVLLGTGFLLDRPRWWQVVVFGSSIFLGMFVLYLCQVRSLVLMLVVYAFVTMVIFALKGRLVRVAALATVVATAMVLAFALAASVGGESIVNRWATLTNGHPEEIYYNNRGIFLQYTITDLLGKYPLGAGLGRWGMTATYFADRTNVEAAPIYVEIQWTGWLLDGGVPLVITYCGAVLIAIVYALRAALGKLGGERHLWLWATVILGYDVAAFVVTFNSPVFMGAPGMEFWLLNAALFVVCARATAEEREGLPRAPPKGAIERAPERVSAAAALDAS